MADGAVLQMIEESILTPAVIEEAIEQLFTIVPRASPHGSIERDRWSDEAARRPVAGT
jgi:hypothetical protein